MLKNAYFLEKKTVKIVSASGAPPDPSFASGGWGPALLLPPTITTLSSSFLSVKCSFITLKKEQNNSSKMFCFWFFRTLVPIFSLQTLQVFVEGGRKNISCPKAQGTLATPLVWTYFMDGILIRAHIPRRVG